VPVTYRAVCDWISAFGAAITENKDYLTELDAAIGDADHGINMDRGMRAVLGKLQPDDEGDIGALLKTTGMTLVSTVGGASGPLYGTLFRRMGAAAAGRPDLSAADWAACLDAGVTGVRNLGKAEPGDKTMIDALMPAAEAVRSALAEGASFDEALGRSAAAAHQGMEATIPLVARKGRASYLGERSANHQDPGATSSWLLIRAAADAFGTGDAGPRDAGAQ
jgi:dihydroxyacetone kinase-like protein